VNTPQFQDGDHAAFEHRSTRPGRGPRLTTESIFREMIAQELRAGRLTRAGRRRIVQYAAQLGLSAIDAGRLLAECRDAALHSEDPRERRLALRVAREAAPPNHVPLRRALAVTAAMAIQLALLAWLLR
jgi:hypothetical protein